MRILASSSVAPQISRRALLGGFGLIGASALLSGCVRSSTIADSIPVDGVLEGQLNIYTWGDYDDPENILAFQRANGLTVQMDSFGSNEEMIAKLGATRGTSGYDIVVPTHNFVQRMGERGLLEPLDHSLLPNMKNLDPVYLDQDWDRGNRFTVPKDWGTTGFAYNTDEIDRELTSWADFLDAAANEANGNTALLEDPWEVASIYFAANGIDPNTEDQADLDACEEYLVNTLAPSVKAFNSTAVQTGIPEETFSLIQAYNGDVRLAMLAMSEVPKNWKFVYPTPTANLWMDNWAIARGSQHLDAAYALINYMLDPEVSYRELDYIGYGTGLKGIDAIAKKSGYVLPELVFPAPEVIERLTPSVFNAAGERQVEILNRMMAKAGS